MDIFDRRIVHPAAASGFRVQGAFKHSTEDRRTDLTPVKRASYIENEVDDIIGKRRNLLV